LPGEKKYQANKKMVLVKQNHQVFGAPEMRALRLGPADTAAQHRGGSPLSLLPAPVLPPHEQAQRAAPAGRVSGWVLLGLLRGARLGGFRCYHLALSPVELQ